MNIQGKMMAARGWARLILYRRRGLINGRSSRAAAAEAPLDGAQGRHHFDNPTNHSRGAFFASCRGEVPSCRVK